MRSGVAGILAQCSTRRRVEKRGRPGLRRVFEIMCAACDLKPVEGDVASWGLRASGGSASGLVEWPPLRGEATATHWR